ncbi:hypothetical protein MLD38_030465 [Melastoma candidum]|uniref:Uncharacterized protein n=1 Tax=Melastoma candidum TaxID=119954 RepID=A0ACB9MMB7_9MYRT|nr:hypothetical protein MLD38_030465 [Melastoma candidum]
MEPRNFCLSLGLLLLVVVISTNVVRSEETSVIRLPSEDDAKNDGANGGICSGFSRGSCPVKCFRPDPVCGENGVTYWCGCPDAACAGVRVTKAGYCEIGNGGSGPLSGQALLLVHIVWLIVLGFSVLFGLF